MKWNEVYDVTDAQLGMSNSTAADDLRDLLDDFGPEALARTRQATVEGRLVRRAFRSGERGCLLFWLTGGAEGGVQTKHELLAYPFSSEEIGWAARRVVRWFDYQLLSDGDILKALDERITAAQGDNTAWQRADQHSICSCVPAAS